MRVPESIRKCVVFVGRHGGRDWAGTAFIMSVPTIVPDVDFTYLVTARHVAERLIDGIDFRIRFNTRDGKSVTATGGSSVRWIYHDDDSVDVAVLGFGGLNPEIHDVRLIPEQRLLTGAHIEDHEIGVGNEVFMVGLFSQLSGSERNLPIVRAGNIAMMPEEQVWVRNAPADVYLIEARSTGGLSGSPVFVRPSGRLALVDYFLLGLVHGHWEVTSESSRRLDTESPGAETVNAGIAVVVPASKILETLNHPELEDERRLKNRELEKKHPFPGTAAE